MAASCPSARRALPRLDDGTFAFSQEPYRKVGLAPRAGKDGWFEQPNGTEETMIDVAALAAAVPAWAVYLAVAGMVGVESVGIPLPGETTLIAATLLVTQPHAPVTAAGLWIAAVIGGSIGDSAGYLVGRTRGNQLLVSLGRRFPRHVTATRVGYASHLMGGHGVWAVLLGRFIALLRILSGPLAGALRLPYRRFLVANVTGAMLWAGLVVGAMTLAGAHAETLIRGGGWVLLALVVAALLILGRTLTATFDRRARDHAATRDSSAPPGV